LRKREIGKRGQKKKFRREKKGGGGRKKGGAGGVGETGQGKGRAITDQNNGVPVLRGDLTMNRWCHHNEILVSD